MRRPTSLPILGGPVTLPVTARGQPQICRRDASRQGGPIDWIEGGALDPPFPAGQFDLVLCQPGLQFFPGRARAPRNAPRAIAFGPDRTQRLQSDRADPGANAFVSALDRVLGPASGFSR
jgi:hypothetical protein